MDRLIGPNATVIGKTAELRYGKIPGLRKQLDAAVEKTGAAPGQGRDAAGGRPDDVAEVVSSWTGVPADRMLEGERQAAPHGR